MTTQKSIYRSAEGKARIQEFYSQLLNDWQCTFMERNLPTSYGNTFVIESGTPSNSDVVLLHGSGSNSAMWKGDVAELSKHFHVFAVDIIGECCKSAETRPAFDDYHYDEWLNEVFNLLNIKKATLIGCSLGGWIALNFAVHRSKKVEKLVLIATAGITPVKIKSVLWIMITSMFGKWGFNQLNKMVYGDLKIDTTTLEFASLIKEQYIPRTDILPLFSDDELRSIKQPLLFIGGDNDCFYNTKKTDFRISELMENGTSKILQNTGHVVVNQSSEIIVFINKMDMER